MNFRTKVVLAVVAVFLLPLSFCVGQETGRLKCDLSSLCQPCPDCVVDCGGGVDEATAIAQLEAVWGDLAVREREIKALRQRVQELESKTLCDFVECAGGEAQGSTWNITPELGLGNDAYSVSAAARWSRLPKWTAGLQWTKIHQDSARFSDSFQYDRFDGLSYYRTKPTPILTPAFHETSWSADRDADALMLTVGRTFRVD